MLLTLDFYTYAQLNEVTKQKTVEVDGQLKSLHSTLMQQKSSVVADKGNLNGEMQKMANERAQQAEDYQKRVQDINKFSEITLGLSK